MDSSDGVIDGVIHSDVLCPSQSIHESHCHSVSQTYSQSDKFFIRIARTCTVRFPGESHTYVARPVRSR